MVNNKIYYNYYANINFILYFLIFFTSITLLLKIKNIDKSLKN